MKPNRLKQILASGGIPVGHMIMEFGTRGMAKILEAAGLDFVLLDMEHTGFDTERIADLIAWLKATPITPIVRVPQGLYHFIARTLDAGALGVMVANVESAEQARAIVAAAKYAPLGNRGVGLGAAHTDYIVPEPLGYFRLANENTVIICMIESPKGVENANAIAATEGVDILWVGHFDLTQAMGIPAQFQSEAFLNAFRRVSAACHNHGKGFGAQPTTLEQAQQWMQLGLNVVSWASDVAIYRTALQAGIEAVRQRASAARGRA
jgi:2-dehydro-3-deoxyglucarate aldolase/4-hydroxy-2-oxoheptanedioate aldolase